MARTPSVELLLDSIIQTAAKIRPLAESFIETNGDEDAVFDFLIEADNSLGDIQDYLEEREATNRIEDAANAR